MEYEAYKVRGYGFGLKKEITGVLGRYPTQEESRTTTRRPACGITCRTVTIWAWSGRSLPANLLPSIRTCFAVRARRS